MGFASECNTEMVDWSEPICGIMIHVGPASPSATAISRAHVDPSGLCHPQVQPRLAAIKYGGKKRGGGGGVACVSEYPEQVGAVQAGMPGVGAGGGG